MDRGCRRHAAVHDKRPVALPLKPAKTAFWSCQQGPFLVSFMSASVSGCSLC
jgi:hypothetical protein